MKLFNINLKNQKKLGVLKVVDIIKTFLQIVKQNSPVSSKIALPWSCMAVTLVGNVCDMHCTQRLDWPRRSHNTTLDFFLSLFGKLSKPIMMRVEKVE